MTAMPHARVHIARLAFAFLVVVSDTAGFSQTKAPGPIMPPYKNSNLPLDLRVDDLVGRMTLEEKVKQMLYNRTTIPSNLRPGNSANIRSACNPDFT